MLFSVIGYYSFREKISVPVITGAEGQPPDKAATFTDKAVIDLYFADYNYITDKMGDTRTSFTLSVVR